ncbi:MAG: hypothetical protein PVF85_08300, partial [Anaerolineales bacterium]
PWLQNAAGFVGELDRCVAAGFSLRRKRALRWMVRWNKRVDVWPVPGQKPVATERDASVRQGDG